MPLSQCQSITLECPECQAGFPADVYWTIDRDEHPAVWERCSRENIHTLTCPNGHTFTRNAGLLLHDSARPLVIFSPAQIPMDKKAQDLMTALVSMVYHALPSDRPREYLKQVEVVPRDALPARLRRPPAPQTSGPEDEPENPENPASLFTEMIGLTRPDQLPRRIQLCRKLLCILAKEDNPELWAMLQFWLGESLQVSPFGDHSRNVEDALQAYEAAVSTARTGHPLWQQMQYNLATAYVERSQGDRDENLEKAIAAWERVVAVQPQQAFSQIWADAQTRLGYVYRHRAPGDRTENFEKAREALEAGAAHANGKNSETWAAIELDLAFVYARRGRGGRAENQERAIQACEAAATVYTRDAHPREWAKIQFMIADLYRERLRGHRAQNLETSLRGLESALSVYTRETSPRDWADVQVGLANTYTARIEGVPEENRARAIQAYEAALTVHTRETAPSRWATIHNNLGMLFLSPGPYSPAYDPERAREEYEWALEVFTPEHHPEEWVSAQGNLAAVYLERVQGEPAENLERAAAACRAALDAAASDWIPEEERRIARLLAQAETKRGNLEDAYLALHAAVDTGEQLYGEALSERGKILEVKENAALYDEMIDVCLRLEPPRILEAFLYSEQGRSRILRDQIGAAPLPVPPHVPASEAAREAKLLQELRSLKTAVANMPDRVNWRRLVEEMGATRQKLDALWNTLCDKYQAGDYVALRRGENLKWEDVQRWLSTQDRRITVLALRVLREDIIAFVLSAAQTEPIVVRVRLSPQRLTQAGQRLQREVHRFDPGRSLQETWRSIGAPLLDAIMPHLQAAELLYIIPHGALHFLPLHALEYEGKPLISYFPITYAPSTAVAMRTAQRALPSHDQNIQSGKRSEVLVVGDPAGDLRFAAEEAKQVAKLFDVPPLPAREATRDRILSELASQKIVHLATHASFDTNDPFESGVILANGEVITVREFQAQTLHVQLTVLSACETGMLGVQPGDETIGLSGALLYAGVPSLVVSQWAVDDCSTAELMSRFYSHLYSPGGIRNMAAADALQRAMLETREEHPSTYHWAPFMLYGDWR